MGKKNVVAGGLHQRTTMKELSVYTSLERGGGLYQTGLPPLSSVPSPSEGRTTSERALPPSLTLARRSNPYCDHVWTVGERCSAERATPKKNHGRRDGKSFLAKEVPQDKKSFDQFLLRRNFGFCDLCLLKQVDRRRRERRHRNEYKAIRDEMGDIVLFPFPFFSTHVEMRTCIVI